MVKVKSRGNLTLKEPPKSILNVFRSAHPSCPSDIQSRVPSDLFSTLMQFQKEGVEYVIIRLGGGLTAATLSLSRYSIARRGRVLLADDMGLGKTIQSIAIACYYRDEWPLLVVCPSSVRMYWAEVYYIYISYIVICLSAIYSPLIGGCLTCQKETSM